jgi:hypothetical protein
MPTDGEQAITDRLGATDVQIGDNGNGNCTLAGVQFDISSAELADEGRRITLTPSAPCPLIEPATELSASTVIRICRP